MQFTHNKSQNESMDIKHVGLREKKEVGET